jgi:hypothetical protein
MHIQVQVDNGGTDRGKSAPTGWRLSIVANSRHVRPGAVQAGSASHARCPVVASAPQHTAFAFALGRRGASARLRAQTPGESIRVCERRVLMVVYCSGWRWRHPRRPRRRRRRPSRSRRHLHRTCSYRPSLIRAARPSPLRRRRSLRAGTAGTPRAPCARRRTEPNAPPVRGWDKRPVQSARPWADEPRREGVPEEQLHAYVHTRQVRPSVCV